MSTTTAGRAAGRFAAQRGERYPFAAVELHQAQRVRGILYAYSRARRRGHSDRARAGAAETPSLPMPGAPPSAASRCRPARRGSDRSRARAATAGRPRGGRRARRTRGSSLRGPAPAGRWPAARSPRAQSSTVHGAGSHARMDVGERALVADRTDADRSLRARSGLGQGAQELPRGFHRPDRIRALARRAAKDPRRPRRSSRRRCRWASGGTRCRIGSRPRPPSPDRNAPRRPGRSSRRSASQAPSRAAARRRTIDARERGPRVIGRYIRAHPEHRQPAPADPTTEYPHAPAHADDGPPPALATRVSPALRSSTAASNRR